MGLGWRLRPGPMGPQSRKYAHQEALAKGRKWVAPKSRPLFASEVGLSRANPHEGEGRRVPLEGWWTARRNLRPGTFDVFWQKRKQFLGADGYLFSLSIGPWRAIFPKKCRRCTNADSRMSRLGRKQL